MSVARSMLKSMFRKLNIFRSEKSKKSLDKKMRRQKGKNKITDSHSGKNYFRGMRTPFHPRKSLSGFYFGNFTPCRRLAGCYYK